MEGNDSPGSALTFYVLLVSLISLLETRTTGFKRYCICSLCLYQPQSQITQVLTSNDPSAQQRAMECFHLSVLILNYDSDKGQLTSIFIASKFESLKKK